MKKILLITFILLINISLNAIKWKCIEYNSIVVYYPETKEYDAYQLLKSVEKNRPFVENLTGHSQIKSYLVLSDQGTFINGYAMPNYNKMEIFTFAPVYGSLAYMDDWYTLVGLHELTHILQMRQARGFNYTLVSLFGDNLYPMTILPGWMTEGITVYAESKYKGNSGRLNNGSTYGVIHSQANENRLPGIVRAGFYNPEKPFVSFYEYGGAFYNFLSNQYGESKFSLFYNENSKNIFAWFTPLFPGLGIDMSARNVFKKSFPKLWEEWMIYEKTSNVLNIVNNDMLLSPENHTMKNIIIDDDNIYYQTNNYYPTDAGRAFIFNEIKQFNIKTEKEKSLYKHPSSFYGEMYKKGNKLYFASNQHISNLDNKSNLGFGSTNELFRYDLDKGKTTSLTKSDFISFCVDDEDIYLIFKNESSVGSSVYALTDDNLQFIFSTELLVLKLFKQNNTYIVNAREYNVNPSIYIIDPINKEHTLISHPDFEERIKSINGDTIIYTSHYDKYFSPYSLNLRTMEVKKLTDNYFIYDFVLNNNSLIGLTLKSDKQRLAKFVLKMTEINFDNYSVKHYDRPQGNLNPTIKQKNVTHQFFEAFIPRVLHSPELYLGNDSLAIGINISNADKIGYIPYWDARLLYDNKFKKFDYTINLSLAMYNPFLFNLGYNTFDDDYFYGSVHYPIYKNAFKSLKEVNTNLTAISKNDLKRKIINPEIQFTFASPQIQSYQSYGLMYENTGYLKSDRHRKGYYSRQHLRFYIPKKSEFSTNVFISYDPEANYDEVFTKDRLGKSFYANQGIRIENTLHKHLFTINNGLWNPNIFFTRVGSGLFFDYTEDFKNSKNHSYITGAKISLGLTFLYRVPLVLETKVGIDKDNEIHWLSTLKGLEF